MRDLNPRSGRILRVAAAVLGVAAASFAFAEGGTIAGKVDVQPARFLDETVVFLKVAPAAASPMTHSIDQKGMKFIPAVLAIQAGDTVEFLNHDGVEHNVYSADNEAFNLGTFRSEDRRRYLFESPGIYRVKCSLHPEMLAYVVVGQNRYAAVVDRKGRFTLKDVPAGTYSLSVWNANVKGTDHPVTVVAGKTVEETFTLKR